MLNVNKPLSNSITENYSTPPTSVFGITSSSKEKQEFLLERNGYSIHIVNSLKQRIKANTLIKRMYASRGYCTKTISTFSHDPHQVTFQASAKEITTGTITLKIGSNKELLADELYRKELDGFRKKGRKICELSKFAAFMHHNSKEIFATLFHLAFIYAYIIHKTNDAFIEINPRHTSFYKRMLGFYPIGEMRICKRVNAPAVLLHLDLDYMSKQIISLAGTCKHNSKSIYPYFLSQHEEKKLAHKIKQYYIETENSALQVT